MNQCMNKRIDDWVDGWMDDWATSLLSSFFTEWPLRWGTSSLRASSLSSLSYFFSLSCSEGAVFFLVFSWWNRALVTATFCRPHAAVSFFLRFWSANRALATVLCTFSRRSRRETENLLGWPREPHHPRKHRVSHPRVFSPMNSHGETELLHFPTILDDDVVDIMMGLSNEYVIDMMLRLRWWCGWHDDDAVDMMMWMLTMTIVLNSKVV